MLLCVHVLHQLHRMIIVIKLTSFVYQVNENDIRKRTGAIPKTTFKVPTQVKTAEGYDEIEKGPVYRHEEGIKCIIFMYFISRV